MVVIATEHVVAAIAYSASVQREASLEAIQIDASGFLEIDCYVGHVPTLPCSPSQLVAYG